MKKIMILMLSLAVLFSFAACDNSSSEPSGNQDTTKVPDSTVKTLADNLKKDISEAFTAAALTTNFAANTDYKIADDYQHYAYVNIDSDQHSDNNRNRKGAATSSVPVR